MFDFENLDVYKLALNFAKQVAKSTENSPRGHWSLVDQFRRASTSIALNIAEGAGRYAKGEKKQFYSIAKGSAYECVPLISLFCDLGLIDTDTATEWKRKSPTYFPNADKIDSKFTERLECLKKISFPLWVFPH